MITQEFIMLIMNCKKYANKADYQKKTWLKFIPRYLKYYHVIGDETLESDYIFDDNNHILHIKVADDYNSLPKKVILAYKAIYSTFDFKYIFKTDDDQMLVNNNFFNNINLSITNLNPSPHYGGFVVDIKQPHNSEYYKIHPELPKNIPVYVTKYCSGRVYFISKESNNNLIKIINNFPWW